MVCHGNLSYLDLTCRLSDDETALYPKRFMLLGLVLFKNILPVLSSDHQHSESCQARLECGSELLLK